MTKKLDLTDKKIIYHLFTDGRMSHSDLSKKVRLSKKGVAYRIERLQKKNIICGFKSIVDLTAVNLSTIVLLLKFNEDIYENPEILDYFKNHTHANWVAVLSGQWDVLVEFVIEDIDRFAKIINDMTNNFSNKLNTYQSFSSYYTLRVEHLVKDFYKELGVKEFIVKPRTKQRYTLDKIDKQLLHLLCDDSSLSYLGIAKKLDTTLDIVRYRIKQLLKKKIIVKFAPVISLENLGYTQYLYSSTRTFN